MSKPKLKPKVIYKYIISMAHKHLKNKTYQRRTPKITVNRPQLSIVVTITVIIIIIIIIITNKASVTPTSGSCRCNLSQVLHHIQLV